MKYGTNRNLVVYALVATQRLFLRGPGAHKNRPACASTSKLPVNFVAAAEKRALPGTMMSFGGAAAMVSVAALGAAGYARPRDTLLCGAPRRRTPTALSVQILNKIGTKYTSEALTEPLL